MDNCTQVFQFDGDIAGIGVRLSFYFQNFILVLLVDRSYEDAENALWTFIATSFGLTVAALVQVGSGNLSLLEGILVSQLAWLANLGTFIALASYSRSKGEDNLVKIAAVFQGYLSMILTIAMWIWGSNFSEGTPCNHEIRFIFFFAIDVPALGPGRIVALVFASLMMIIYTAVTFRECMEWRHHRKAHKPVKESSQDIEMEASPSTRERMAASEGVSRKKRRKGRKNSQNSSRQPSRQKWLGADVDPIFTGVFMTQVVVFAYFISTTEVIVRKNTVPGVVGSTNQWGFGQVLALTVVFPSLIALVRAIRRNRIAKLKKEQKEQKANESLEMPINPKRKDTGISTLKPRLQLNLPTDQPFSPLGGGEGLVASPSSGLAPINPQLVHGASTSSTSTSQLIIPGDHHLGRGASKSSTSNSHCQDEDH